MVINSDRVRIGDFVLSVNSTIYKYSHTLTLTLTCIIFPHEITHHELTSH